MNQTENNLTDLNGLSVDFGGTKIFAARFVQGKITESRRELTQAEASIDDQVAAVKSMLDSLDIQDDDRVGMAVSGRVNSDGVWHAVNTNTLSAIDDAPLKSMLQETLGRSVSVINDAVAGGLAEARFGAGQGVDSFVYITVSTGVGGVCILSGVPAVSRRGLAGHIGFMTSRRATKVCGCGRTETLESVASGRAIERYAAEHDTRLPDSRTVFEYSRKGTPWAQKIVVRSAEAVAETSVDLAAALGIERVVLGGSVGLAEGYAELVANAVACEPLLFQIDVAPAALGQQSVLIGALLHI